MVRARLVGRLCERWAELTPLALPTLASYAAVWEVLTVSEISVAASGLSSSSACLLLLPLPLGVALP